MRLNNKSVVKIVVLMSLVFFLAGCSSGMFSKKPEGEQTATGQPKSRKTTAVYYDFEDVLIPMELSIVNDRTVVVSTPGFTSGILTLKGRVDRRSLFNFFSNNMQKDNWNVLSQIKSPATTIMVFQKSSRISVINIRDENIFTYVEIGVAPTISGQTGLSESSLTE